MKEAQSKAVLFFVYALCGAFMLSVSCRALLGYDFTVTTNADIPASQNEMSAVDANGENKAEEKPKESTDTNESKAVPTASKGSALGKISEKYISPYTANTNYKNVYLKNCTELNIDLKSLLESKLAFSLDKSTSPQVLILHTHATESYMLNNNDYYTKNDLTRTTNNSNNMIAIGDIVAKKLNDSGISTLHDKTQHDYPSYNESYSKAAKTICSYKAKYPSIKIVIDLHRDSVAINESEKAKLTKDINGKKAAQVMLVMGSQSGNVKNFPNYEQNLKLAVKMQSRIEKMYPGLARSILLMSKNYNESLTNGSVLIEVGTEANTLTEAKYSAELLGNALSELFKEL